MSDVAVIFGGPSPEHDVSVLTGLQAARGLAAAAGSPGTVRALFWSKTGDWYEVDPTLEAEAFLEGVPKGATRVQLLATPDGGFAEPSGRLGRARTFDIDAALVCCHGGPGEDGSLQAALDLAGVRYSGPTVSGAALGMDKLAFGAVVAGAGLPTLPRLLLTADSEPPAFAGPYIVKPRFGGSSIGIDVVEDFATATARLQANPHLRFGGVIEPFRSDLTDLQVAVRSWPALQLSAIERPIRATAAATTAATSTAAATTAAATTAATSAILDYRDKYVAGEGMAGARRELPALIEPELETSLRHAAETIAALANLRGVARIDFLSDGTQFVVNEINTIPGSLARYLWVDPTLPFATLLGDLLEEARRSPTHAYSAAGADGTVLRSAGSIAGKLG